ncbi:MAG: lysylphosphatidylglycerol synthase transmembrane domain-containing protein [Cytophagales bacterium]|nr:flippase-like domain-containing protein [Bernardetiaceae bacterium]MDW8209780.1 lysylphosphatidylglycerol synthase transmembrane domain-containing protein [Cytophagales bacterium]
MQQSQEKILRSLKPSKIVLPLLIGGGVAIYMFLTQIDLNTVGQYVQKANLTWILVAILVLLIRDGGYVWRIRYLTNGELSWKSSIYTILLWEFASAVTPSAVGGTAVAVFIINREGIRFGKSLAYVMLTALLDNSFFILAAPIGLLLSQGEAFPTYEEGTGLFGIGLRATFWASYVLISAYTLFFAWGLFFKPHGFRWLLVRLTSRGWLKRFQKSAQEIGNDVVIASDQIKGKNAVYWLNAIISTIFVWSARYLMVNCLLAAFTRLTLENHLLIFARHVVMWVIMLISPTPGSSGTAELSFDFFFGQYIGSFGVALALFWRLYTYYPYLFVGVMILPRWLRRVLAKEREQVA